MSWFTRVYGRYICASLRIKHKVIDTLCLKTVHKGEFEDGDEHQCLR